MSVSRELENGIPHVFSIPPPEPVQRGTDRLVGYYTLVAPPSKEQRIYRQQLKINQIGEIVFQLDEVIHQKSAAKSRLFLAQSTDF